MKTLYDSLAARDSLDDFLNDFGPKRMRLLLDECVPRPLKRVARTNRLRELRPLAPKILDALSSVTAGSTMRVGASS